MALAPGQTWLFHVALVGSGRWLGPTSDNTACSLVCWVLPNLLSGVEHTSHFLPRDVCHHGVRCREILVSGLALLLLTWYPWSRHDARKLMASKVL